MYLSSRKSVSDAFLLSLDASSQSSINSTMENSSSMTVPKPSKMSWPKENISSTMKTSINSSRERVETEDVSKDSGDVGTLVVIA